MRTAHTTLPAQRTYTVPTLDGPTVIADSDDTTWLQVWQEPGPVVSRTVQDTPTGRMYFEVTVLRTPDQRNPTYQGSVHLGTDGLWHADAVTDYAATTIGRYGDYADAETVLVERRTGIRSTQTWTGPRPARRHRPTCHTCGHHLGHDGVCRRNDLHWTPESIAAEEARRAQRRQQRAATQERSS